MQNQPLINYQNSVSTNDIAGEKPLSEIFDLIKNGSPQTNRLIAFARRWGKGTPQYIDIKEHHLPAFLFNFKFNKTVANKNIICPTGLLYLDIDGFESEHHLSCTQEELKHIPYVLACWRSLSEKGLSVLVSVKGMNAKNYNLFKTYFKGFYKYNEETKNGLNLDDNAWKLVQKTVLSRDEDIYINEECIPLSYNEVLNCCLVFKFIKRKEKVSYTLLKEEKREIGQCMTPFEYNRGVIRTNSHNKYLTLTDRHLHADKDKEYTVYPEGVFFNKIFLRKSHKIKVGKRATVMFSQACKYIRLYGEQFTYVFNFLKMVRNQYCENPDTISDEELNRIAKNALKNYKSDKIKMATGKIFFPLDSKLTKKEKESIRGKEVGKIRSNKTVEWLGDIYKKGMRQVDLINIVGISKESTVKRYWNEDADGNIYFAPKAKINHSVVPECAPTMPEPLSAETSTHQLYPGNITEGVMFDELIDGNHLQESPLQPNESVHEESEFKEKKGEAKKEQEETPRELTEEDIEAIYTDEGWEKYNEGFVAAKEKRQRKKDEEDDPYLRREHKSSEFKKSGEDELLDENYDDANEQEAEEW